MEIFFSPTVFTRGTPGGQASFFQGLQKARRGPEKSPIGGKGSGMLVGSSRPFPWAGPSRWCARRMGGKRVGEPL